MNEITTAITEVKTKVSLEEWQQRIIDCRQSGMSIRTWCRENGVATSSYYHYLRRIRESTPVYKRTALDIKQTKKRKKVRVPRLTFGDECRFRRFRKISYRLLVAGWSSQRSGVTPKKREVPEMQVVERMKNGKKEPK